MEESREVDVSGNVLVNPTFTTSVQGWSGNCCKLIHSSAQGWKGILGPRGQPFAIVAERTAGWQGIQQDITALVQPNEPYLVTAVLRTQGGSPSDILATVSLNYGDSNTRYLQVGRCMSTLLLNLPQCRQKMTIKYLYSAFFQFWLCQIFHATKINLFI